MFAVTSEDYSSGAYDRSGRSRGHGAEWLLGKAASLNGTGNSARVARSDQVGCLSWRPMASIGRRPPSPFGT